MSKVSFSRVECWRQCPKKYYYRYVEGIRVEPELKPDNALILGSTMDRGIEKGYEEAEKYYFEQFPTRSEAMETELMKIHHWVPQVRKMLHDGRFQVKIETDDFIGFADYVEDNLLADFKYTSHPENYKDSAQLHVYASMMDPRPEYMCYVCVPKLFINKYKDGETKGEYKERMDRLRDWQYNDIVKFRQYIKEELEQMDIEVIHIDYDQDKVDEFWRDAEAMLQDRTFEIRKNDYCTYCDYKNLCKPPRKFKKKPI